MTTTAADQSHDKTEVIDRSSLTIGYLLRFSGPLVATFFMMAAAAPIIDHGISWIKDAEGERVHLSAFLLISAVAVFIYSPMFVARDVANRTVTDRTSLLRFIWFFMFWSGVAAVLLLAVSQVRAVRHFVFIDLLKGTPETEQLAVAGMLVFVVMPFLVVLRGLGQGCHINNGQTWHVGVGTALRVAAIALFVYGFAVRHDMSGPVLGGLTYLIGMAVESTYVLTTLRGKPQWTRVRHGPALTFWQFTRYAGPLMAGSFLLQFCPPMLIYLINRAHLPSENAAAYNIVRDCFWFMVSFLLAVPPLFVTHATSARNFRLLLRLCVIATLILTAAIALLTIPAVSDKVFVHYFKVDNRQILALISRALLWVLPMPALMFLTYLLTALHTRSGRTTWVTAGNLVGLFFLLSIILWDYLEGFALNPHAAGTADAWGGKLVLWVATLSGKESLLHLLAWGRLTAHNGAIVAVACNAGFLLVSTLVQAIGLLRGGLAAAIDPGSLAEQLQRNQKPPLNIRPEPVPVCVGEAGEA